MFWNRKNENNSNKNPINSSEYERVYKRTIEIDSEIKALKSSIDLLKTDVADLRGNFDSRLRKIRARGIEEQQPDVKTEEFNNSGEVPFG